MQAQQIAAFDPQGQDYTFFQKRGDGPGMGSEKLVLQQGRVYDSSGQQHPPDVEFLNRRGLAITMDARRLLRVADHQARYDQEIAELTLRHQAELQERLAQLLTEQKEVEEQERIANAPPLAAEHNVFNPPPLIPLKFEASPMQAIPNLIPLKAMGPAPLSQEQIQINRKILDLRAQTGQDVAVPVNNFMPSGRVRSVQGQEVEAGEINWTAGR